MANQGKPVNTQPRTHSSKAHSAGNKTIDRHAMPAGIFARQQACQGREAGEKRAEQQRENCRERCSHSAEIVQAYIHPTYASQETSPGRTPNPSPSLGEDRCSDSRAGPVPSARGPQAGKSQTARSQNRRRAEHEGREHSVARENSRRPSGCAEFSRRSPA